MEIGNVRDLENCYVCSEYMGPFKNELTVVTGYSEKPIGLLIGETRVFYYLNFNLNHISD